MSFVAWFFSLVSGKAFNDIVDAIEIKMGIKKEPLTGPEAEALLDEYLRPIKDRIAQQETYMGEKLSQHVQRLISRLDEERLVKLISGFSQLRAASSTGLSRESLASAFQSFHDIANLPAEGQTAGLPNAQLRCLALLGMASVHIELPDSDDVIAEKIVAAIYADPSTSERWVGKELVQKILKEGANTSSEVMVLGATHVPNEERHILQQPLLKADSKQTDVFFDNVRESQLQITRNGDDVSIHPNTLKVFENGPAAILYNQNATSTSSGGSRKPPLGTILVTYKGHSHHPIAGPYHHATSVSWSPDGKYIASGGTDGTVQVWNAFDGDPIYTYHGHFDSQTDWWLCVVETVAWSPDGKYIASGGRDKTVQVWNAFDGDRIYTYHGHTSTVDTVAWSPDSKRLAFADSNVHMWDATKGRSRLIYRGGRKTLAWSPTGKYIASGGLLHRAVEIWEAATGHKLLEYPHQKEELLLEALSTAWSPDCRCLVTGFGGPAGYASEVRIWGAMTGHTLWAYTTSGSTDAVAWSPDGKYIAFSSGGAIQIWNVSNFSHIYTFDSYSGGACSIAWSSDSQKIVAAAEKIYVRQVI